MICPNCGKETSPHEVCDICGKPTEFANRMDNLSVGSSANQIHRTKEDDSICKNSQRASTQVVYYTPNKKSWLPWVVVLVVLLAVNLVTEEINHLFLVHKIENINASDISAVSQMETMVDESVVDQEQDMPSEVANSTINSEEETEGMELIDNTILEECTESSDEEYPQIIEEQNVSADSQYDLNATTGRQNVCAVYFDFNVEGDIPAVVNLLRLPSPIFEGEQIPAPFDSATDEYTIEDNAGLWGFLEWNTRKDGSGLSFDVGELVDISLSEPITLYAQWKLVSDIGNSE